MGKAQQNEWIGGVANDGLPSLIAAAHELKSPLALVRQLALSLETMEIGEEERSKIIRQIRMTTERSIGLTSDLTKVANLDNALFELEPVNPQQLCKDIARELAPLFLARGRSIIVKNRRRAPLAIANHHLLGRVIASFSDNALHYSAPQSSVEIKTTELASRGMVRVSVRDFGPAINKSKLQKILNGEKLDSHLMSRPQSSGLGLYIAKNFAEAMNGSIGIIRHSDGATFYIDMHQSKQLQLL